jgi:hypothetical protein
VQVVVQAAVGQLQTGLLVQVVQLVQQDRVTIFFLQVVQVRPA